MTSHRLTSALLWILAMPLATPCFPAPLEITRKTLTSVSGARVETESGRLAVPENRSTPGSRTIFVEFLRLKSSSQTPTAPLVYFAGGPGSRGISESPQLLDFLLPFLAVSDVVLINERGTNDSLLFWSWDGPPARNYFLHADTASRHVETLSRRALSAFRQRGVDLAGYTTVESADDVEALRIALGVERISLLGFSYGTHLGTCYMRRYPERVESAVLMGMEGPDETLKFPWTMDVSLKKLALLAARDPKIVSRVPDLVALYDRVIAKLARQPMTVTVPQRSGRDSIHVPVGPFGLRFILRVDMGDATDLPVFPRLLWSIDQGDPSVLAWFVRKRFGVSNGVHGMSTAMDLASGASPARLGLIAEQSKTSRFADVMNFPSTAATASWKVPDLGEDFRAPLVSSVRTLLVSGELDMNTPPYQAERLRWGMTDATHLIVDHAGHEQTLFQNDTAVPVITDFLAGRDVVDRRITYPPLRFVPLEGSDPQVSHPSVPR